MDESQAQRCDKYIALAYARLAVHFDQSVVCVQQISCPFGLDLVKLFVRLFSSADAGMYVFSLIVFLRYARSAALHPRR